MRYRLNDRSSIPARANILVFICPVQRSDQRWGPRSHLLNGHQERIPEGGLRRPEHDVDNSPGPSVEVQSLAVFKVWCLIKQRGNCFYKAFCGIVLTKEAT
jgi:hypothetical protein